MRILLSGYGRMGRMIEALALEAGDTVAGAIDLANADALAASDFAADVILDFSSPSMLPLLAPFVQRTGTPLISGTTGYTPDDLAAFNALGAYAPVLHSANYSIGVSVLRRALRDAAATLLPAFDAEITETHHNQKADAPSGTAKLLYDAIDPRHEYTPVYGREGFCGKRGAREIGMHALRGGTVAGEHSVYFFGPDEELCFTHRAASRKIFASGALRAAHAIVALPKGSYTFDQILFGENA